MKFFRQSLSSKLALNLMVVASVASLTSACSRNISPNAYTERHVGESSRTFRGVIISSRIVRIEGGDRLEDNQTGLMAGGLGGAVAGSQIGNGSGSLAAAVAGGLIGATVGAFAERELKAQDGIEYTVELSNGELRTVVQGEPKMNIGDRVLLMVSRQGRSRIVPDNSSK